MKSNAREGLSQSQGKRFEETFAELIERLIRDELKLDLIEVVPQPGGTQRGRDIQVKWRNPEGATRLWHFECKSKGEGVLQEKEFTDKLMQEVISPQDIDVWCLTLSDAEPSVGSDDLIASLSDKLGLGFSLCVLSPRRVGIRFLYSFYRDLHIRQYGKEPYSMSKKERRRRAEAFGDWLEEVSRQRPSGAPEGWLALTRRWVAEVADDDASAVAYLRGLGGSEPWGAAIHAWAVPRKSTEERLWRTIDGGRPGFQYDWLVAGGGEGKTTVLVRLAHRVLTTLDDVLVFWTDETRNARLPVTWLQRLPSGSRVLFGVDGARGFSGLSQGVGLSRGLEEAGIQVGVVLAERGNRWKSQRARLLPGRQRKDPVLLEPLSQSEREALVDKLEERGLLRTASRSEAQDRLLDASRHARGEIQRGHPVRAWLLSTVIELTDPEKRSFDRILISILEDLHDSREDSSLCLLLAVSLLEAAGPCLPHDLAVRLVPSEEDFLRALETLDSELERQLHLPTSFFTQTDLMRTRGTVISEEFIRVAREDGGLHSWLERVCSLLPSLVADDFDSSQALPQHRFDILDAAVRFLDGEVDDFQDAVAVLAGWVRFDIHGFATWNRLGSTYTHWLQRALFAADPDEQELRRIAEEARGAFRRAIEVAEKTLGRPPVPAPYVGYDLGDERRITYRSWSMLEATIGGHSAKVLGGRDDLIRSVYLSLIGASTRHRGRVATAGLLARALDNLGEVDLAAPFAAFLRTAEGARSARLRRLSRSVTEAATEIESAGDELLVRSCLNLVPGVLEGHWHALTIKGDEAGHKQFLRDALKRYAREMRTPLDAEVDSVLSG